MFSPRQILDAPSGSVTGPVHLFFRPQLSHRSLWETLPHTGLSYVLLSHPVLPLPSSDHTTVSLSRVPWGQGSGPSTGRWLVNE